MDEVGQLIAELIRQQWTRVCFGPKTQPSAIAAIRQHQCWADVVVLRGHDQAAAYRTILGPGDDPLTAEYVLWHYIGSPADVLRAALSLSWDIPVAASHPIPEQCRIPEAQRRPITIRLV
jgi:hypothetical protein